MGSEQKEELRGMHVSRVQKLANAYYKSNQEIIDSWEDLKAMMQTEVVLPEKGNKETVEPQPPTEPYPEPDAPDQCCPPKPPVKKKK